VSPVRPQKISGLLPVIPRILPHCNGNSRILKWRYCAIFLAIFCGYIPLHRPDKGLTYGRYLQFLSVPESWPLIHDDPKNLHMKIWSKKNLLGGFKAWNYQFSHWYMGCHPSRIDELIFFKIVIAPPTRYLPFNPEMRDVNFVFKSLRIFFANCQKLQINPSFKSRWRHLDS